MSLRWLVTGIAAVTKKMLPVCCTQAGGPECGEVNVSRLVGLSACEGVVGWRLDCSIGSSFIF